MADKFRFLIREQALLLVASMLNEDGSIVRVCASCEREFGPLRVGPGQQKSHGFCRRHMIDYALRELGDPGYAGEVKAMPDEVFAPDLAGHPELVGQ